MSATDDEDFVAYVTGRLPVLRRLATQVAGDAHRGDDLVLQAITRQFTHRRRASRTENLDAYVYKILTCVFLDERAPLTAGCLPAGTYRVRDPDRSWPAVADRDECLRVPEIDCL